ncbi:MAG: hypothetical protein V4690_02225 [Patescibacteria group bacterium]
MGIEGVNFDSASEVVAPETPEVLDEVPASGSLGNSISEAILGPKNGESDEEIIDAVNEMSSAEISRDYVEKVEEEKQMAGDEFDAERRAELDEIKRELGIE